MDNWKMLVLTFILICSLQINYAANPFLKQKPDFIKTCQFGDPNFAKCVTTQVQGLFNQLSDGLPEIGIMPLDPLKISKINILSGEGPVSIDLSLRDVTIKGFRDLKVAYSSVDPKTYEFVAKTNFPKFTIEGKYKSNGRILVVPLNGNGDCWIECSDMDVEAKIQNKLYQKDNHYFYNVTSAHIDFDFKGFKIKLTNLFDDKQLDEGTNDYLNKNWKELAATVKPIIGDTIEDILLKILSKFFNNLPAEYFESDIANTLK